MIRPELFTWWIKYPTTLLIRGNAFVSHCVKVRVECAAIRTHKLLSGFYFLHSELGIGRFELDNCLPMAIPIHLEQFR